LFGNESGIGTHYLVLRGRKIHDLGDLFCACDVSVADPFGQVHELPSETDGQEASGGGQCL
jgi:hypothetical protein